MPYLEISLSHACKKGQAAALLESTREQLANLLTIAPSWVLVQVRHDAEEMQFGASDARSAHVEVRVEGTIDAVRAQGVFEVLFSALSEHAQVEPSHCYVHIVEVPRQYCGWNGRAM